MEKNGNRFVDYGENQFTTNDKHRSLTQAEINEYIDQRAQALLKQIHDYYAASSNQQSEGQEEGQDE